MGKPTVLKKKMKQKKGTKPFDNHAANKQFKKILDVNNLFKDQLEEIQQQYELTEVQSDNLDMLKEHLQNMNNLFTQIQKQA